MTTWSDIILNGGLQGLQKLGLSPKQPGSVGMADHRDLRCVGLHPSENQSWVSFPCCFSKAGCSDEKKNWTIAHPMEVGTGSSWMHKSFLLLQGSFRWKVINLLWFKWPVVGIMTLAFSTYMQRKSGTAHFVRAVPGLILTRKCINPGKLKKHKH